MNLNILVFKKDSVVSIPIIALILSRWVYPNKKQRDFINFPVAIFIDHTCWSHKE